MTESPANASGPRNGDASIDAVSELGWRQLSVLPPVLAAIAREAAGDRVQVTEGELIVVASHDCDVCARNEILEPDVELLAVTILGRNRLDGAFSHLKSPRRIDFVADLLGERLYCQARAHRRWWIPRHQLLREGPQGQLVPNPPDLLARWLGRRYDRSALPDTFNDRIRAVDAAIQTAVEQHGNLITGLYVTLSDESELPDDQKYAVILTAVVRVEDASPGNLLDVQQVVDTLAGHLSACSGIDLHDSVVLTEADVTVQDLRVLRRLDMEALSYASEPPGHVAPPA